VVSNGGYPNLDCHVSVYGTGHVAELVGIVGGVVSGVINLESSGA